MSCSTKTSAAGLAIGLSCALAAYVAVAQTVQPGQSGRPQTIQRPTTGMNQPGQATSRGAYQQDVNQFFAECLLTKNHNEVEISQLAAQQAQDPQVKQYAQQMIEEHQQLIQKLQPLAGSQSGRQPQEQRTSFGNSPNTPQANGQAGISRPGTGAQAGEAGEPSSALHQVAAVGQKIDEQVAQSLKEKLQKEQGENFDRCFLNAEIACHMQMAAALEVLKDHTSGQLQQIVQEAQPKVEQHLAKAEQLADQTRTASRPRSNQGNATSSEPR